MDQFVQAFQNAFKGKRILVTGHTGFKGAWLVEWLLGMEVDIWGYSLSPPTQPSLYEQLSHGGRIRDVQGDIRDRVKLTETIRECRPDFVFHLAAQPLVRLSYAEPVATYETNVIGTVNLLEALRVSARSCTVVMVTTDKCYENRDWNFGYREEDALGGHDPYSSSKAAAEIAIAAYRRSFFSPQHIVDGRHAPVAVISARAGNVIGGGDWALDRIVPDAIRALVASEAVRVRNPHATRPWQHVLEPLGGYLVAALKANQALQNQNRKLLEERAAAFNFGPTLNSNRSVGILVKEILHYWPGDWIDCSDPMALHEAGKLNLTIDKSYHVLGWLPIWTFETTVRHTIDWYRNLQGAPSSAIRDYTAKQIFDYSQALEIALKL